MGHMMDRLGHAMDTMSSVAVVIVNWNRRDDTLRCIASVQASTGCRPDIFLVDNASSDGSVEAVAAAHPDVNIVVNELNLGFAEGNNVALRRVLAANYPYVMLLNNDTAVAADALQWMLETMRLHPRVGVVSPAICYLDQPDIVWSAGGTIDWRSGSVGSSFFNAPRQGLPTEPFEAGHVSGCCMLLTRSAILDAGLLDPRFFMYYEETEWCVRIARSGHRILVAPRAVIWHAIEPRRQEGSPAIAYYMTRNHLLFLSATRAPLRAWIMTVGAQLRTVGSLFITPQSLARSRGRVPMLRAMRDFARGRFGPVTG